MVFGRSALLDDLANRVTLTENTVGINLPRIATLEHRTNDIDKKLALLDRRLEKIVQRRNLDEDFAEHESWLGPVGPAAGTQSLSPSEPKQDSENPFAMPTAPDNPTAFLATSAPLWTEEAGNS